MPRLDKPITDKVVRTLPVPDRGNVLHRDPELRGFCVRVTANGDRAYVLAYRFAGTERRDTIGSSTAWSASAAREVAKRWRRDVREGVDPRGPTAPEADEDRTFAELAAEFLDHGRSKRGRSLRPATLRGYRHSLLDHAKDLGPKPVDQIRRGDVAKLIREVAAEHGATSAMRTRAALSRLWSWLVANDLAEANVVAGTEGYATTRRDRVLDDVELRALWEASSEPTAFHVIVRMICWTGCRRHEAGGMRAEELVDGTWTVPGERTKNHRPATLPLPRQALEALEGWRARRAGYLFGANGFQAWSQSKARLDRRLGIAPFGLHDLRRTVQTRLAGLGVRPDVANAVLNHATDPITETYDRHGRLAEKAEALQRWADELDRITGRPVAEVVPIRSARHDG